MPYLCIRNHHNNEEKYNLDNSNDNGSRLPGPSLLADLLYGADG